MRTSDQHTVKPGFDGRLDFSPQVKDLAGSGFDLIGGSLDVLHGQRVAALVYRRRLHVINLFQWPATVAAPNEGERTRAGYHVIQWNDTGMHYVAVSNLNDAELDAFVRAFRGMPAIAAEATH
ncbi:MAG: hypothetical protein ABI132_12350 [Rhodanobacteraceae bacterium]